MSISFVSNNNYNVPPIPHKEKQNLVFRTISSAKGFFSRLSKKIGLTNQSAPTPREVVSLSTLEPSKKSSSSTEICTKITTYLRQSIASEDSFDLDLSSIDKSENSLTPSSTLSSHAKTIKSAIQEETGFGFPAETREIIGGDASIRRNSDTGSIASFDIHSIYSSQEDLEDSFTF